jgi:hypothetical protein
MKIKDLANNEFKTLKCERNKILEYAWIFKDSFTVRAYLCGTKDGRKFIVMAHDFNDMEEFITPIRCKFGRFNMKTRTAHKDTPMEEQEEWHSYIVDKKGNPKKYPFWYRGRVYEITEGKKTVNQPRL